MNKVNKRQGAFMYMRRFLLSCFRCSFRKREEGGEEKEELPGSGPFPVLSGRNHKKTERMPLGFGIIRES